MLIAGDINFALFTNRGYTMHEHLEDMGIIHMNGRIYDPLIGRFMSADPYIQDASDLQSYNRYSYVRNNPMNLTDPSGYSWLSKTWKKVWASPIFRAVVGIVVAVAAPYLLAPILGAGSFATVVVSGALSGFASTGTLKGALTGAFTAGIMYGVGTIAGDLAKSGSDVAKSAFGDGGIGKIALHAGAGCLSGMAGGGSCKSGAIGAALGEFGHNIDVGLGMAAGITKSAMMGGIGSKLAGGKFADGATTGAFGYLFNFCMHDSGCSLNKIGEKFIGQIKGVFVKASDVATDAIAVCGIAFGPCRAADFVLGTEKAAIDLLSKGDGRTAAGAGVGEASTRILESVLSTANTNSIPGNRIPKAVVQGTAFLTGKVAEKLWIEPTTPQK